MFGKLKGYRTDGNKVYFEYEGSKTSPVLEAITDNIVNVLVDYTGGIGQGPWKESWGSA